MQSLSLKYSNIIFLQISLYFQRDTHTSMAPLKLRDGNTYTLMYTHIYRKRHIHDSNEKPKLFTKNSLVSS